MSDRQWKIGVDLDFDDAVFNRITFNELISSLQTHYNAVTPEIIWAELDRILDRRKSDMLFVMEQNLEAVMAKFKKEQEMVKSNKPEELNEALGIRCSYADARTGKPVSFREFCGEAIERLGGLSAVTPCIPFTKEYIREKIQEDVDLNNTPIMIWEEAAGYRFDSFGNCEFVGGKLCALFQEHRINIPSCARGVSILKEAARLWTEEGEGVG